MRAVAVASVDEGRGGFFGGVSLMVISPPLRLRALARTSASERSAGSLVADGDGRLVVVPLLIGKKVAGEGLTVIGRPETARVKSRQIESRISKQCMVVAGEKVCEGGAFED